MLSRDQFAHKGDSLIDRYNNDNPIREQLLKYGYKQGYSSDEFISPNSKSGHQVKVFGNVATSLSTSDAGVGVEGNGSHNVDSFGLYRFYECDNDLNTAIQNIAAHYRGVQRVMKNSVTSYRPAKAATAKTDIELASEVHDLIGHDCIICDPTEVVYLWDNEKPRYGWQRLHDPELRNMVRAKLLAFTNKPTVTLVNNVTKAIKDMAYQRDPKMNLGGNEIVSFLNGDVQLLQGKWHLADTLLEHRRITRIPHCYDPTATAPMFCEFLDQTFDGDDDALDKQQLILQMMGYSLQTHARHEKGIMTVGVGGNGKSVLDSVVKGMVGHDNFAAVQPNNLDNNFQKATMRLKLVNAITESEQSSKLPTGHVKAIISGEAMTVENKRKDPFVMHPFCTLWWATNHLPHANDYSEAIYRRMFIVEFNNTVPPEKRDTELANKLVEQEMPGIIRMALDAYAEAVRSGFALPDSVTDARKTWRIKSDSVAGWFYDCVEVVMLNEVEITSTSCIRTLRSLVQGWRVFSSVRDQLQRQNDES